MQDLTENQVPRPGSWAFYLALSLLGPLFFFTYILSILSPLPNLYLHAGIPNRRQGRLWWFISSLLGLAVVFALKGAPWAFGFFLFSSLPSLLLGEFLLRGYRPEWSILLTTTLLAVSVLAFVIAFIPGHSLSQIKASGKQKTQEIISIFLDKNQHDLPENTQQELQKMKADPELVMEELPGLLISSLLVLSILPCIALIRWNPKGFLHRAGISRDFLRKWASPEWLVWPALACGFFLIVPVSPLDEIAKNLLNPLLVIYFFQGMSILAYFLDSMRLRGPIRILFYGVGAVFLTPMVVSFGFFDLWFQFRGRFKTGEEKDKEP